MLPRSHPSPYSKQHLDHSRITNSHIRPASCPTMNHCEDVYRTVQFSNTSYLKLIIGTAYRVCGAVSMQLSGILLLVVWCFKPSRQEISNNCGRWIQVVPCRQLTYEAEHRLVKNYKCAHGQAQCFLWMQVTKHTGRSSRFLSQPNGSGSRRYGYDDWSMSDIAGGYAGLTRSPALLPCTMEPGDGWYWLPWADVRWGSKWGS